MPIWMPVAALVLFMERVLLLKVQFPPSGTDCLLPCTAERALMGQAADSERGIRAALHILHRADLLPQHRESKIDGCKAVILK